MGFTERGARRKTRRGVCQEPRTPCAEIPVRLTRALLFPGDRGGEAQRIVPDPAGAQVRSQTNPDEGWKVWCCHHLEVKQRLQSHLCGKGGLLSSVGSQNPLSKWHWNILIWDFSFHAVRGITESKCKHLVVLGVRELEGRREEWQ